MATPPRVWISNARPAPGEPVRVRAQIEHPMESGLRTDAEGRLRPRHILTRFEARLGATLLFAWEPGISVAQNPYIEFTFLARESGELVLRWSDDKNSQTEARKAITLS